MSKDPLIGKLSQFNPVSNSIDRDALLFAAGRASVPRKRGWQALAGILACSQAAMLALWISHASSPVPGLGTSPLLAELPMPNSMAQLAGADLKSSSYAKLMQQAASGDLPAPIPIEDPVRPRSILSTDSSSLNSLLE
jgi:hypothetical protein